MFPKGDHPHIRYTFDRQTHIKYRRLMKTLNSCLQFDLSDPAKSRLHILEFYYRYGLRPTMTAFGVAKSTLYDWKNCFESHKGRLISLVPKSTRPHQTRKMTTDWRLVAFIKQMRVDHGNIGANMIKPFLDAYAEELKINSLARATIEKIIKRRHFTFESRVQVKRKTKFQKLRIRKSPKVRKPGYLQMDSITVYINQEKYLFMSVIDVFTKMALVKRVEALSAVNAVRVLQSFQVVCPYPIRKMQTDNGSEFLASFHQYLEERHIPHIFIYPRSPKINGIVERFNRTIQEECINRSDEIYYDVPAFESQLQKYLNWYNYQRPHYALGYLSPMQFINTKIPKSG